MIVLLVDSMERAYFFERLVQEVRNEFNVLFVTSEPLAHRRLLKLGHRCLYVRHNLSKSRTSNPALNDAHIEASIEVLNGRITLANARRDAEAAASLLGNLFANNTIHRCFVWNGQQILGRTVSAVAAAMGVPVLYLEISNLPSKLFVDVEGVNALSSIRRNSNVIQQYALPIQEVHTAWMIEYERYKSAPLPQARIRWKWRAAALVNMLLKRATRGLIQSSLALSAFDHRGPFVVSARHYTGEELRGLNYVFLPLQVSADTQIKLHSDVDNFQAIERAAKIAENFNARLLVKVHPAERDLGSIRRLVKLQRELSFEFTTASTVELIRYARHIVTINSTVGLEALLYGKPLTTLGRALYENFDNNSLLKYIHGFLVDNIDYFGNSPVPAAAARYLLAGAGRT